MHQIFCTHNPCSILDECQPKSERPPLHLLQQGQIQSNQINNAFLPDASNVFSLSMDHRQASQYHQKYLRDTKGAIYKSVCDKQNQQMSSKSLKIKFSMIVQPQTLKNLKNQISSQCTTNLQTNNFSSFSFNPYQHVLMNEGVKTQKINQLADNISKKENQVVPKEQYIRLLEQNKYLKRIISQQYFPIKDSYYRLKCQQLQHKQMITILEQKVKKLGHKLKNCSKNQQRQHYL